MFKDSCLATVLEDSILRYCWLSNTAAAGVVCISAISHIIIWFTDSWSRLQ